MSQYLQEPTNQAVKLIAAAAFYLTALVIGVVFFHSELYAIFSLVCQQIPISAIFFLGLIMPFFLAALYICLRLQRFNDRLVLQLREVEDSVTAKTAELENTRNDLLKLHEQLLLALQTGKICIFKWNLQAGSMEITQTESANSDRFRQRQVSVRLFKRSLHSEDRDEVMSKLAKFISGSTDQFDVDCRIKLQSKNFGWFHLIGKIVERSSTGIGSLMIGILEDITELKARESAMQQSQKLEAVGQLAGGIAHDFNNMLQAISGFAELVKLSLSADDQNHWVIDQLIEATIKSQSLVRQLLSFSRMSQETRETLDVNKILSDLIVMLRRLLGIRIELKTKLAEGLPYITANAGQIEQIVMNLCLNARDAIPGDGQIVIKSEEAKIDEAFCLKFPWAHSGHFVKITVADTGKGIAEENLKKIYEPFFTTKGVGKGTGLGLAIVYGLVQKHGGFIHLTSEPDHGSTFEIYIPVSRIMSELKARTFEVIKENLEGNETILLAEDSELVRNFAGRTLRKAGYNVIFACDGQEAVEKFGEHSDSIDILVFDIIMPRMTGKVAYEEIQKISKNVPVVFCSGYHEEILDTGFYTNFNGIFLPKPFKTNELLKRIRILLDKDKGAV